jgi:hypothetical protein
MRPMRSVVRRVLYLRRWKQREGTGP